MKFGLTMIFLDGYSRKTSRSYEIEAIDHATALADAASFVAATAPMTRCGIVKWRLWQDVDYATAVVPGANKAAGLTMVWELSPAGSEKLAPTKLPAPFEAHFDSNGNLDLADAAVLAYAAQMTSGNVLISDGEVAVELKKGTLDK